MIAFKSLPLASLSELRKLYLASLRYRQELHCEWLVETKVDGEEVGYDEALCHSVLILITLI